MKSLSTVRMKVSPQVAHLVREAPRETRLLALSGELPLPGNDLLVLLFFLLNGEDREERQSALARLRDLPVDLIGPLVQDSETHPHLLDLVARVRLNDPAVMGILLANPAVSPQTLARVAARAEGEVVSLLLGMEDRWRNEPDILQAIFDNPHADPALLSHLGMREDGVEPPGAGEEGTVPPLEDAGEGQDEGDEDYPQEGETEGGEEVNLSKYQTALQLEVSEKIKLALTGDKEWRAIFLKDPNKLVSSAVLKNPRITEGEVLAVAKNKSASDELIRLITLNQEWIKNYEIQKALVHHPRTPLPKALRYMNILTPKDLKSLAKSRGVAQAIVNNARRMVVAKDRTR